MKNRFIIPLLFLIPILLLGCTAESLEPNNVEAAEPNTIANIEAAKAYDLVSDVPDFVPKYCPVTQQPREPFTPPEPFKQEPYPGQFFYGTSDLWTALPTNNTWQNLPYNREHGFGQKVFFQRTGYNWQDEPVPNLTVTGHNINPETTETILLNSSRVTNGYTPDDGSFMLVGAEMPTAGCWEITAQYDVDELTFVVWVAP